MKRPGAGGSTTSAAAAQAPGESSGSGVLLGTSSTPGAGHRRTASEDLRLAAARLAAAEEAAAEAAAAAEPFLASCDVAAAAEYGDEIGEGEHSPAPEALENSSNTAETQSPGGSRRRRFRSYFKKSSGRNKLPTRPTHVFGVPLEEAVHRSRMGDNLELPAVFRRCIAYIEAHGLKHEGLYRLPGQKSRIEKLRHLFDTQGDIDLENVLMSGQGEDLNVAASLLKLYLRELPDALLTEQLLPDFASVGRLESTAARSAGLRDLLCQLPLPNYLLMGWLVRHLAHVAGHSAINKMSLVNLYIVFGPTVHVSQNLLSHMLDQRDELFPDVTIIKAPRLEHVLAPAGSSSAAGSKLASSPVRSGAGGGSGPDTNTATASRSPGARRKSRVSRFLLSGRTGSGGARNASSTAAADDRSSSPAHANASAKLQDTSKRDAVPDADGAANMVDEEAVSAAAEAVSASDAVETAQDRDELQRLTREVMLVEKDLDLTRKDMARHDAIGQDFPASQLEAFLDRQRQLTQTKRRIKLLRQRLGLHDATVSGLSRSHMAAMLNQLYCSMLLQRLELLAVRDKLSHKLQTEQIACRALEQELQALHVVAPLVEPEPGRPSTAGSHSSPSRPQTVREVLRVASRPASIDVDTGAPEGVTAPKQVLLSPLSASRRRMVLDVDMDDDGTGGAATTTAPEMSALSEQPHALSSDPANRALNKLEQACAALRQRQEQLKADLQANMTELQHTTQTCMERRVDLNMLWLERHPAPPSGGSVRRPGASEGSAGTTRPQRSAAEEENWAHAFHARQWHYRCSEQRLPLSSALGPQGRHIVAASPPPRPASVLELAPFPSKDALLETSSAWAPLTPGRLSSSCGVGHGGVGASDGVMVMRAAVQDEEEGLGDADRASDSGRLSDHNRLTTPAAGPREQGGFPRSPSMASAAFVFDDLLSSSGSSLSSLASGDLHLPASPHEQEQLERATRAPGWGVVSTHDARHTSAVELASSDEEGSV